MFADLNISILTCWSEGSPGICANLSKDVSLVNRLKKMSLLRGLCVRFEASRVAYCGACAYALVLEKDAVFLIR